MKNLIAICVATTFMSLGYQSIAQAPAKFNYQGIARGTAGEPLSGQAIKLKISILANTSGGTVEYSETQSVTTNTFGLYNVAIGNGTPISGTMGSIDWSLGNKFVKVEIDPTGGNNFSNLGSVELLSVPYALYANTSGSGPAGPAGAQGPVGPAGAQGPAGPVGATGAQGPSGATGAQGLAGAQGPAGPIGATGVPGATGPIGATGATGPAGAQGPAGPQGATGLQGPIGPSGGPVGPAGPAGPQGPGGATGATGPAGPAGATGAQGATGPQGPAGTSTYTAGTGISISSSTINAQTGTALWNASKLQGNDVSTTVPTNNQVLKWNGTAWAPSADADAQTLSLTGSTLSITGGNSVTLPTTGGGSLSGVTNYIPKFNSATSVNNSALYQQGNRVGLGTTAPTAFLQIQATDSIGIIANYVGTNSALLPNGVIRGIDQSTTQNKGVGVFGIALTTNDLVASGTGVFGNGGNVGVRAQGQANTVDGYVFGTHSVAVGEDTAIALYGASGGYTNIGGVKYGLYALAQDGSQNYGVYAAAPNGINDYAGYFDGDVHVNGSLSKSMGTFKIDHPKDPDNKYLYHSFVESPEMMNVYNGNVTTDVSGYAIVTLPDYFDALNKDYRYQLTVVGETFAQAIVSKKVNGNTFQVRTSTGNVEVSWQVTGVRNDAYAQAHRVVPEVEKAPDHKGKYLNPVELGKNPELQINAPMPVSEKDFKVSSPSMIKSNGR